MAKTAEAEVTKLRVKIGPHEFEAEGPRDVVAKHFEAWKQLVATRPLGEGTAGLLLPRGDAGTPAAGDMARLDIFAANTRRNLVTLRASLAGKASHADAALLILYGLRRYFGADGQEVLATRLKEALAASGYRCDRVDRALARHEREVCRPVPPRQKAPQAPDGASRDERGRLLCNFSVVHPWSHAALTADFSRSTAAYKDDGTREAHQRTVCRFEQADQSHPCHSRGCCRWSPATHLAVCRTGAGLHQRRCLRKVPSMHQWEVLHAERFQ